MSPLAGRAPACGIFRSKSALRLLQLSTPGRAGGASFVSRAGDFASAHAASVSISVGRSDRSFENFLHLDQRTTGAWISAAWRGGWRWRMAASLRTFRRASGRCPRRGGNFGNAARGWAAHRDKSSGDSLWELAAQTIRAAAQEGTTARRSEQETYEVLGWRELACGFDARPPSAVARSFKVYYFLFLPVASPTGRGKTGICLVGTANPIVFEARAYISYNVEFVYGRGRFIGWLEQKIRASWGIASFWGSSSWSSEAACCFTSFRIRRSAARFPPKPWPRSGTSRLACRMCASSSTRSSSAIRT